METNLILLAVLSIFWLGAVCVLVGEFIGTGFGEMVETVFFELNKGFALPRKKYQRALLCCYLLCLAAFIVSGCLERLEYAAFVVFMIFPRSAVVFLSVPAMLIAGIVNIWRQLVDGFEKMLL